MIILWAIILIFFIVVEVVTINLVTIWFAGGSLIALFLAIGGAAITWQLLSFFIVSGILLLIFILIIKPKMNDRNHIRVATNADRLLGQKGIVTEDINYLVGTGRILVMGQDWRAVSDNNLFIAKDESVEIVNFSGVKAIVRKVE